MAYRLEFNHLIEYDAGQPGISLETSLKLAGREVYVAAKLDTGATNCIFARRHGEQLGLDIESGEEVYVGTATGRFKTYRHEVTLNVLGYGFDVRVCFAEERHFRRDVLGRQGFLDRVRLGLIDYDGQLYLSEYNEEE
jgi:predicted aspartyl protease